MSGFKGTPVPWLAEGLTVYALNDDGYNRFSALVQDAHTPGDELEANARLIGAAPELLEALEGMVEFYGYAEQGPIEDARAAIRKALGEE